MIAIFLARYGLHLALAAGVLVTVATWDRNRIKQAEGRGVQKEQVRVETQAKKSDATAKANRKSVANAPASGVLEGHYRD